MTKEYTALIVYHAECWDGLAAAWATEKGIKERFMEKDETVLNIRLCAAKYGDVCPSLNGADDVYIVDFSYDRETLIKLNEDVPGTLVVLDHHKTAEERLKGLDFCHFDMTKSGARLAWEYFFPDSPNPPRWMMHIEDRDLWRWKYTNTEVFTTWIFSQEMTLERLNEIDQHLERSTKDVNDHLYEEYFDKGRSMLKYRDQLVATIAEKAIPVQLGDYTVYAVNTSVLHSEVGHAIAKEHDAYAATYYHTGEGTVKFSLRSEGERDVSAIAQLFGGGGHKNAAGFLLPEEKAANLFNNAIVKPG